MSPALMADDEMQLKVEESTVSLISLSEGMVRAEQIERAFSPEGCGAVIVKLDGPDRALYEHHYRLQWQLGARAFDDDVSEEVAGARFVALDLPVQQLLCRSGIGVARTRRGLTNPMAHTPIDVTMLLRSDGAPLPSTVGRPLFANRHEFHPSVEWLLKQEDSGSMREDVNPLYYSVERSRNRGGHAITTRRQADEPRLLELYREWESASPEKRRGDGDKFNGDVYYGAFRGRTHMDVGRTMTVCFGPGELRDRKGFPVARQTNARELGGTLMVASPGEEAFTALPYRLPCGSPYVVVFFEDYDELTPPSPIGEQSTINTRARGWAATVHGVRRIEDTGFSRGQTVVHLSVTEDDLV